MNTAERLELNRTREASKAQSLRALANARWGMRDMLEIFGRGLQNRVVATSRHDSVGKNYFSNHFHAGARNPAGSKLLRRFIRQSKKEQHTERKMYAALTGRQYNHLNNPEQ